MTCRLRAAATPGTACSASSTGRARRGASGRESADSACDIFDHGSAWSSNIYTAHHQPAIYLTRIHGRGYDEAIAPAAECRADALAMGTTAPDDTGAFDAATLRELARVVRPGGTIAGLEFAVPHGLWRPWWELYVRVALPLAGRVISPGWAEVGGFLGPSIRNFYERWPEPRLVELWDAAGIAGARSQRLSLGGGIVTWGRRA